MKSFTCSLFLGFCLLFPPRLFSQSTNATINGVIADATGRAIVAVDLEIVNDATGVHYSGKTNGSGIYTVSILPPGHYTVQASKLGFKTIITPGIVLNVQSALDLNFTLPVGATSETVTVEAGSSLLNTTDASVSTVVDRKFVANMPLNGRSFQDLISMTPGIVTQSPQTSQTPSYQGDFSVNGQRTESNYYMVDGVSGNVGSGYPTGSGQSSSSGSISATTALGTTQSLISVDALQEFRVQSSTYSAEYGRSPGGQFSFATRAGTNGFHGSAFDYLRNNAFDANDWFNNYYGKPQAALRQNDFGGTLGGPIWIPHLYRGQNKTFFFASYEGLRLTQPQAAAVQYVPDTFMRQQAPALLQPILNAFPIQTGKDYGSATAPSLAEFIQSYSVPSRIDSTSVRVDHTLSPKLALFFRYGGTPSNTDSRALSTLSAIRVDTQTYTLGATSQLAAHLNNEFRLGYARSNSVRNRTLDGFGGAVPIDLAHAMGIGSYPNAYPDIYFNFSGIGTSSLYTQTAKNEGRQWNIVDTTSTTFAHHQVKLGFDFRNIRSPLFPATPNVEAYYLNAKAFTTNAATYLLAYKLLNAAPVFKEFAAFIQDDWRPIPRISISMGLRWEVNPPPSAAAGQAPYTVLGNIDQPSTLTLAPQGTPLWATTWYNFAPRLGFAWQAHSNPGWETVVRTGGGVFFDTDNQLAAEGFIGVGFQSYKIYPNAPIPISASQLDFSVSPSAPYTGSSVFGFSSHLQLPYTLQWNLSLQQAVATKQTFTLSYVAANGRRLLEQQAHYVNALNPNFNYIGYTRNGVSSNYQSLQVQFQRSVSRGIQALASYTWSHSLDYGSNNAALPLTRGNSDFDVRHNFQSGVSWDIPSFKRSMLPVLTNGWGLDGRFIARSGFPVTLQGAYITESSTGNGFYGNVNLVDNQPIYLHGSQYPGGMALNRAAFSTPAAGTPGNAPRNFVRGFGESQVNLTARKDFRLKEKLSLQFRAEAFNLLNRPSFGYIDPGLTSATFGRATQMLNQSLGTVSSQYQQGGPRSMQLALKLLF